MSQRQWVVIIGVWVMILPFIGFPSSWIKALFLLTGVGIIAFAYRIRFKEGMPVSDGTFAESKPAMTVQETSVPAENDNPAPPTA